MRSGNVNGIDTERSKGYQNVQFLSNVEKEVQGFAYINMDTDILEGCTIKAEYELDSTNQSEVDRVNENLYKIRYAMGAAEEKYGNAGVYYDNNYNANATAAELLARNYYEKKAEKSYYDLESGKEYYSYLKRLKKPYKSDGETSIEEVNLDGTEYYGMYLGQTYYTGQKGDNDIVAQLKVDHILNYVDNDFTFDLSKNNTKDKLWQATTSNELKNVLDFEYVNHEEVGGENKLIDRYKIRYDTDNRTNLALSVDDNKNGQDFDNQERENGNVSLSRFLKTNKEVQTEKDYKADITIFASKVLSANDLEKGKGLSYENIAEIVQYTSLTGRRTTLPEVNAEEGGGVIGNANVNENKDFCYSGFEDDTDATEVITISPPTGLTQ